MTKDKVTETNEIETDVQDDSTKVKRKHEVKEGGLLGKTLEKKEVTEERSDDVL